ncbi:MAG: hypothetical protein J7M05_14590 [Anaerolineae bacterium]|nr:hypothetical protein [Anaerolineae bacterium]
MRPSRVLRKLRNDEPVLVGSPTPYPSAKICELLGKVGYDCVWIDHEHQDLTDHDIWHMCLAARATDMDAMVRIRKGPYWSYFHAFESGANGIMVPHCLDAEEAKWVVRNAKFAPLGLRGVDGIEAHADHSLQPMDEYMQQANQETFIVVQIEDKEALKKIDEIAAVEGVDVLFIGPADLGQSLGIPRDTESPHMQEIIERVATTARRHGKHWGIPAGSARQVAMFLEKGARFIAWGAAIIALAESFSQKKAEFDRIVASRT